MWVTQGFSVSPHRHTHRQQFWLERCAICMFPSTLRVHPTPRELHMLPFLHILWSLFLGQGWAGTSAPYSSCLHALCAMLFDFCDATEFNSMQPSRVACKWRLLSLFAGSRPTPHVQFHWAIPSVTNERQCMEESSWGAPFHCHCLFCIDPCICSCKSEPVRRW